MTRNVATTKPRKRKSALTESPRIELSCGCLAWGGLNASQCALAEALWERVAVANHNLTVTQRVTADWKVTGRTTIRTYGPAHVKAREAIYEYRLARWRDHFKRKVTK